VAKQLLMSVVVARDISRYDLSDFDYIEPYIAHKYDDSYGRMSYCPSIEKTKEIRLVHAVVESTWFTFAIACAIIANCIWATALNDRADIKENFVMECLFASIFALEFLLKFADMGWGFFKHPKTEDCIVQQTQGDLLSETSWNRFDFVLVVMGIAGVIFSGVISDGGEAQADNSGGSEDERIFRVNQVLRIMRIMRLVRLFHIWLVLKAKINKVFFSQEVAEHMQKNTVLNCCVRAHIESQKNLAKYFGRHGQADSVEVARSILQSQVVCYKCLCLIVKEKNLLDNRLVEEVSILSTCKELAEELEQFVDGAFKAGILTAHEAESILDPVHAHMKVFLRKLRDGQHGRLRPTQCHTTDSDHVFGDGRTELTAVSTDDTKEANRTSPRQPLVEPPCRGLSAQTVGKRGATAVDGVSGNGHGASGLADHQARSGGGEHEDTDQEGKCLESSVENTAQRHGSSVPKIRRKKKSKGGGPKATTNADRTQAGIGAHDDQERLLGDPKQLTTAEHCLNNEPPASTKGSSSTCTDGEGPQQLPLSSPSGHFDAGHNNAPIGASGKTRSRSPHASPKQGRWPAKQDQSLGGQGHSHNHVPRRDANTADAGECQGKDEEAACRRKKQHTAPKKQHIESANVEPGVGFTGLQEVVC